MLSMDVLRGCLQLKQIGRACMVDTEPMFPPISFYTLFQTLWKIIVAE